VGSDLSIEVNIERRTAEDGKNAIPRPTKRSNHFSSPFEENASTRLITSVIRRQ